MDEAGDGRYQGDRRGNLNFGPYKVLEAVNPVQTRIGNRVGLFPRELAPLKDACHRYLRFCCAVDTDDTVMIAHRPWVAPLNYLITLYPGAKPSWFGKYRQLHGITIPPVLRSLLSVTNGCFVFGLSLFGMPPSMRKNPPMLDRTRLQCLDIASANQHWKQQYATHSQHFYFGSRYYSDCENAAYFLVGRTSIVAVLKDGNVIGEWSDLGSFLNDEIQASEKRECSDVPEDWWH